MRRAVLDLGTNSVRLLVADVVHGEVRPLIQLSRVTRLGQGVGASGNLRPEAMDRTLAAIVELAKEIPQGVETQVLATSAVRDAENQGQFAKAIKELVGLPLRVLSGEEEAKLSFAGAVLSLRSLGLETPLSVVDIGGGSTEIYTGLADGSLLGGGSTQVGAVRMLERFITSHPLIPTEQAALEEAIRDLLVPLMEENLAYGPKTLIAVGGTATSLAAMVQDLIEFDPLKVTGFQMTLTQLREIYEKLGKLTLKERQQIPTLQAGRDDIIVCGASILVQVVEGLGFERLYTSVGDLLYGSCAIAVDEG